MELKGELSHFYSDLSITGTLSALTVIRDDEKEAKVCEKACLYLS